MLPHSSVSRSVVGIALAAVVLLGGAYAVYWFSQHGMTRLQPDIQRVQTSVDEMTTDSLNAQLRITVRNNLPIGLRIDSLQYVIAVDGDSLAQGDQSRAIQLRANAPSQITLPVRAGTPEVLDFIRNKQRDSADVHIRAFLYTHFPIIGSKAIPVTINRTIYVPKLPKIEVENVKIDKFNLKEGTLLTTLKITNFNSFPLTIEGFSYQFQMGDNVRVNGQEREDVALQRTGTERITFPVHLTLREVGEAAWKLLFRDKTTSYNLSGVVQIQPELASMGQINLNFSNQGTVQELKDLAKDAIEEKKEDKKEAKAEKKDRKQERKEEKKQERQEKREEKGGNN